jgi:hypothetical protein
MVALKAALPVRPAHRLQILLALVPVAAALLPVEVALVVVLAAVQEVLAVLVVQAAPVVLVVQAAPVVPVLAALVELVVTAQAPVVRDLELAFASRIRASTSARIRLRRCLAPR